MAIPKDFKIRTATPKDFLALHNIYQTTWLDTYPNKKLNITVSDINYLFKQMLSPEKVKNSKKKLRQKDKNNLRLVLEHAGQLIGLCNATKTNDYNQINAIYILPTYQRLGLGMKLYSEAKNFFGTKKDITVRVASYNKKAINFYKKLGFVSTRKIYHDDKFKMKNGSIIPELEMIIKK